MKWYFVLQIKMLNRHLNDFGVPPALAYPILLLLFVLGSNFIFYSIESEYAAYVYLLVAVSTVLKLGEKKRNDFLKLSFTRKAYGKIRILENVLILIPFAIYLIYESEYLQILYLYLLGLIFSKFTVSTPSSFVIPTPFSKQPFEFSSGFRKTFYIYPVVYWLTYKSVEVQNFNLGIFSLLLLFFTLISYYTKMENQFYVWSFKYSAKEFLLKKIKIGVRFATLLSLPIFITLSIFFTESIVIVIVFQCLCFLYFIQAIIAKYSDFPKQINLPNSMIFALSLSLIPFVVITFRYFYNKSMLKLKSVLNDKH